MAIQFKIKKIGSSSILYDADILVDPSLDLFDVDYHTNTDSQQNKLANSGDSEAVEGIGRAKVIYFELAGKSMVLKHYYRGGLVSSVIKDQYFGFNVEKTRSFREWCLLKTMQKLGLPVPKAIAAHVKQGLFYYQADLITQEIEGAYTLADVLTREALSTVQWKKVSSCIKKFHDNNIYHSDLNARNILLTEDGTVYLIDFDNSYLRQESSSWKRANLTRLKRSLLKFKNSERQFNFDESNWSDFLEGYS